jgi:acetate kinase
VFRGWGGPVSGSRTETSCRSGAGSIGGAGKGARAVTPLILTVNAGSSSVKVAVFEEGDAGPAQVRAQVSGLGFQPTLTWSAADGRAAAPRPLPVSADSGAALDHLLDELARQNLLHQVSRVGHRIVHGGSAYTTPTLLDAVAMEALHQLIPLAPMHQPDNLGGVAAISRRLPDALHIGCFDTAFHAGQPRLARLYALPRELLDDGLIAYGFHGLSYQYIAAQLPAGRRAVVAHLGSGASLCALADGRSQATTMGMSPLDGLPMATRCGAVDPGLILHLIESRGLSAAAVRELLYEKSGLLGVSGFSGDMAVLLESSTPTAREAVDLFVYRVRREIGAMAAVLGGIDTLVFTAGIGENSAQIRGSVCEALGWLGLVLDPAANAAGRSLISAAASAVEVRVIRTDEEQVIAQSVRGWGTAPAAATVT